MTKKSVQRIPDFNPRPYQIPFLTAMDEGCKRAVLVWHRRAGKEIVCFNHLIKMAFWHRVGTYIYFFPTARLGRRILWDGMDKDGKRFLDYIPKCIIDGQPNSVEMKIKLTNGSTIQVMGTDMIVNVGVNPIGCVFSEFSIQDPYSWNFTRPILRENGGWAVFNFTPRGKNAAYDLYLMAKHNPDWFCQLLSIDDTKVLNSTDMEIERAEGMSEVLIQQEFYCSFDQGAEGAYYAKLLNKAELEGRLTHVPYDPMKSVDTYWDLGVGDETVILFVQNVGQEIHIIDMYRNQGEGLNHYAKVIKDKAEQHSWVYGDHYAPHDIQVRELGSGAQTRLDIARDLGIPFMIVPKLSIAEGIELMRGIFPRLWVDTDKCKFFIKSAENYHKHFNEKLNVYSDRPVHDWSSHTCFLGNTLVATPTGQRRIDSINEGDVVITPYGEKRVLRTFNKTASQLTNVITTNSQIYCTPTHNVYSEKGLVPADALRYNDRVYSLGEREWIGLNFHGENLGFRENFLFQKMKGRSSLKDTHIDGMDFTIEGPSLQKIPTALYIEPSGSIIMSQSTPNIMCTIKMGIQKIMTYLTWSVLNVQNICRSICGQRREGLNHENQSIKQWRLQRYGIDQKKERNGTANTQNKWDLVKMRSRWFVGSVIKISLVRSIIKYFVQPPVRIKTGIKERLITKKDPVSCVPLLLPVINTLKKQRVVSNVPLNLENKAAAVYDLEIEDDHCYFANGLLVSNCDAARYMAVIQNKHSRGHMSEEDADKYENLYHKRL
jgi:phage terminase large subunit